MTSELYAIQDFVNQAIDDYKLLANNACKNGTPELASYYDGINRGMELLLDFIKSHDE